ncbi:homocysteine S-methyltransferase family protein [Photobacterium swingsii]|uniref:homocysteine S-methyltransferase family protein n=1 Tax=Photobacterium swingsii TaxID=680026 RepID=UPI003D0BED81
MKKLTILDGGMGRELKRIDAPFSQPLWSAQALIESHDHVRLAHQNFIDSGAEIIIANSYACVPFHLGDELYQTDGALLARQAAVIAQSVAQNEHTLRGNPVRVAGSIPPAFGSYRPDLFKAEEAKEIFTTLFDAQAPHVDLWIAETIASLQEFEVIHSVLKNSNKDCYYSFSLQDDTEPEAKLRSGQPVKIAAALVCFTGGKGIYFNCSIPEVMEQAIKDAKEVIDHYGADVEIGVYANNFTPIHSDHRANNTLQSMRELSPKDYLAFAKHWYALGATTIGGCCGIGPEHIQAIAEWRDTFEKH